MNSNKKNGVAARILENGQFAEILDFTLRWEGGYVNDPYDRGGETKYGISKRAYPGLDIANMTREDAALIYWKDYYVRAGCLGMPAPKAAAVFDTAVNCGVSRASRWARNANWMEVCKRRADHYEAMVESDPNYKKFRKGWFNRLAALERFCEKLENEFAASKEHQSLEQGGSHEEVPAES